MSRLTAMQACVRDLDERLTIDSPCVARVEFPH